jgi:hypothetical protein
VIAGLVMRRRGVMMFRGLMMLFGCVHVMFRSRMFEWHRFSF